MNKWMTPEIMKEVLTFLIDECHPVGEINVRPAELREIVSRFDLKYSFHQTHIRAYLGELRITSRWDKIWEEKNREFLAEVRAENAQQDSLDNK